MYKLQSDDKIASIDRTSLPLPLSLPVMELVKYYYYTDPSCVECLCVTAEAVVGGGEKEGSNANA